MITSLKVENNFDQNLTYYDKSLRNIGYKGHILKQ